MAMLGTTDYEALSINDAGIDPNALRVNDTANNLQATAAINSDVAGIAGAAVVITAAYSAAIGLQVIPVWGTIAGIVIAALAAICSMCLSLCGKSAKKRAAQRQQSFQNGYADVIGTFTEGSLSFGEVYDGLKYFGMNPKGTGEVADV